MSIRLDFVPEASPDLRETILQGVRAFNAMLFAEAPKGQDLAIAITDETGAAVGGLLGRTAGGWLAIELIFVPEPLRGQGLASRLVAMAEEKARTRGCHAAWLDTLNPDARRLYEQLGYAVFGELPDYPAGFTRAFLRKAL
ncbi:MAG TPA: GNAT family N-acetyltransferase [Microvirga sp.]|jgi:GNAT superfamily N-acetyltransferase